MSTYNITFPQRLMIIQLNLSVPTRTAHIFGSAGPLTSPRLMPIGTTRRAFGSRATIYDPWHYVPILTRKPGALRNAAPFKDWVLPASLERVRRKLAGRDEGDRQIVKILAAVLSEDCPPSKPPALRPWPRASI